MRTGMKGSSILMACGYLKYVLDEFLKAWRRIIGERIYYSKVISLTIIISVKIFYLKAYY